MLLLALLGSSLALAQETGPSSAPAVPAIRLAGTTYLALEPLLRLFGATASGSSESLTLRSDAGVLTLFAGSSEVLWQARGSTEPEETSVSAPLLLRDDAWFVPPDLLEFFGARLDGEQLFLGGQPRATLVFAGAAEVRADTFEIVDLGNGVPGLRLFAAGNNGPEALSLLLADLGLLALALPELQPTLDAFVSSFERDKPLYLVITSLADEAWEPVIRISQDAQTLEARYPFRLRLLQGDANRVSPGAPVVGVILLPDSFDLRRPLEVEWAGARASVTFRR